jgi:hypothetical protein
VSGGACVRGACVRRCVRASGGACVQRVRPEVGASGA